jgi:hypothetical protein
MRDNIEHGFSRRLANWHVLKYGLPHVFNWPEEIQLCTHSPVQPCQLETYPKVSLHCLNKLYQFPNFLGQSFETLEPVLLFLHKHLLWFFGCVPPKKFKSLRDMDVGKFSVLGCTKVL